MENLLTKKEAIKAMCDGAHVCRPEWENKDAYLYMNDAGDIYRSNEDVEKVAFHRGNGWQIHICTPKPKFKVNQLVVSSVGYVKIAEIIPRLQGESYQLYSVRKGMGSISVRVNEDSLTKVTDVILE